MIKPFNIILVTTAFLFLILGLYNYLLFYLLVKIFCIMVGFSIYSIGWNAKQFIKENLLIFLSLGYLIISVFTILHVVSLSEINVFPQLETNNKSIQFWIMARTVEGISFLLTGFFINKDIDKDIKNFFLKNNLLSSIYIILTVILSILIFLPGILPVCSYNINEYTNFKINCEYFISFIFALTAILFWKNKNKLNREVFQLLFISILISIPANILFTFNYSGIYFYDMSGHILKYISFFLVYKALVVNSLKKPYHNLFQQYNHSQKRLVATGSMISTLFHDLKNPLSTIRAMSQIGCMKTKTKEAENYFARIESKVDNISHMITRMLNTFRPEEPKKINIKEPFQEILEDIKPVCETKNIQIIFQNENPEHVLNAILEVNLFKRAI
ncbi:MAG: MASE3 domain-containing protein, partial [Candidatus Woesearchaeota archaeon]